MSTRSDIGLPLFLVILWFGMTILEVIRAYPRLAAAGRPVELVLFAALLLAPFGGCGICISACR